jgi:hypothetical protein
MQAILNKKDRAQYQNKFVEVMHRRGGKDLAGMMIAQVCCFAEPGIYWHVLPTYEQGRKVIWDGVDNEGRRFTDYWPNSMITKSRDDIMKLEMEIPWLNPETGDMERKTSIYQVIGGDRADRVVGANPKGIIFSEYSLMNPMAWKLLRPCLEANNGWALFIYTPRGSNHGLEILDTAKKNGWYHEVQPITLTRRSDGQPIVSPTQFKRICTEEVDEGGEEDAPLAHQEYMCSFTAPMQGAYFAKEMRDAEAEDRIVDGLRWERELPVYTSWDLGVSDQTVIWYYQIVAGWIHYIDYEIGFDVGVDYYCKVCQDKPYLYKNHYAPHDIKKRSFAAKGKSPLDVAAALGFRFTVVPQTRNLDMDINIVRLALRKAKFDKEKCDHGIKALREYSRKWDPQAKIWSSRPIHNWASHPVDAFRTGAMVMPDLTPRVKRPTKWSQDMTFNELLAEHDRIVRSERRSFRRM